MGLLLTFTLSPPSRASSHPAHILRQNPSICDVSHLVCVQEDIFYGFKLTSYSPKTLMVIQHFVNRVRCLQFDTDSAQVLQFHWSTFHRTNLDLDLPDSQLQYVNHCLGVHSALTAWKAHNEARQSVKTLKLFLIEIRTDFGGSALIETAQLHRCEGLNFNANLELSSDEVSIHHFKMKVQLRRVVWMQEDIPERLRVTQVGGCYQDWLDLD